MKDSTNEASKIDLVSEESILSPTLQFLSDYGIPIDKQSLSAVEDILQTDINEAENDWKIYEENCQNLRQRHNWNDENNSTAADGRNMHHGRGIPIHLHNATVNGFRMVFPMAGRREQRADGNNDAGQNNNGDDDDAADHGVRIEPIIPPPHEGNDPMDHVDAVMPQVINNPDGTFTINLGNLDDLAAGAIPVDLHADRNHHPQRMGVDPPDANDAENEEMFGIARAAMAAVFGFQTGNEGNVENNMNNHMDNNNNENNNENNINMNGGIPMAGLQNFFQQINGGAVGGGVFVGGVGNNGGFPFQDIIGLAMNANNAAQQPQAEPVHDQVMTDIEEDNDDDDDVEEVPIM
jgi:hypothetical protein